MSMDQTLNAATLKSRMRKKWLMGVAVSLFFVVSIYVLNWWISPSVNLGEIRLSTVRMGAIENTINAAGVVVPMREEQLSSPSQSRISRVLVRVGQNVRAGELLMTLDDKTIQLAIDNLREQIAQQAIRVQVLQLEMETSLKKIASEIELLELDLQSNTVKLARHQKLGPIGITSAVDLQAAELAVKRNQVQLRQHKDLLSDIRKTAHSNIQATILQKSIFQGQMELQLKYLDQTQVKAPFDGLLTWMLAEEGASVNLGQLVAKVSDAHNFKVEATISDFYARYLRVGQKIRVEYSGQKIDGVLQTILPEMQNGSVKCWIKLAQADHPLLKHQLRVEVNIITEQKNHSLIVDAGPAINGKGRQEVFALEAGKTGIATRRSIDIGALDTSIAEIRSGATVGDQLIISDTNRFKHLASIRVRE